MSDPLILIPARMTATRLPGKPLADIHGEAMIVHVWRRAIESGIGPVAVATDEPLIVAAIEAVGGVAVLTRASNELGAGRGARARHASGSSAAAFVAPVAPAASTALRAVEEFEVGVQAPAGFFDPLNYCEDQPESFARRRAVERKHGRISMMAFVGILVHNADIEFPGYISKSQGVKFSDIPDGIYGFSKIPAAGILQIFLLTGPSSSRGGPRRTTPATTASASGARSGRARTSCRS